MASGKMAKLVVLIGSAVLSIGAALVYGPAGLIVAGAAVVLFGLFLMDDGEDVLEPRTARPPRSS
jgi:uncharacterized membrane protein YccC